MTKLTDLLPPLTNFSVGLSLLFFTFINQDELKASKLEIVNNGHVVTNFVAVLVHLIAVIVFFIFRHKSWESVLLLHEIDQKFGKMHRDFKNIRKLFVRIFLTITASAIPLTCFIYSLDSSLLNLALFMYFGIFYTSSCAAIFNINIEIVMKIHTKSLRMFLKSRCILPNFWSIS